MTPFVKDQIKADEGLRLQAYPDPRSPLATELRKPLAGRREDWMHLSGDPWTIGYGCTGPGIGPGTVWTQSEADSEFDHRFQGMVSDLDITLPWWVHLDDVRQDVIANMAWNLGVEGLLEFKNTLKLLQLAEFGMAADSMMKSLWAREVPRRAQRLALMMRTGVSQTVH